MANVVITGSTKGIGFGLAKEFASRGHNVVIAGRSQQAVDEAIAKVGNVSGKLIGRPCDTSRAEDVQALWDAAASSFGSVDVWINNAGLARTTHNIVDFPEEDITAMLHTNVLGTIHGCQTAVRGMTKQGAGKIFNVLGGGSDGEYFKGMGIYGTTKRGLDYLTNALVKELKGSPIIVGKIRPGMIVTEGLIREAKEDPANFNKQRRLLNILSDRIETVAPYLVENVLACNTSGSKIKWLSGMRITSKFLLSSFKKPADKFAEFGV